MEFVTYLISGIALGSVYAVIALGYSLVYGIAKMLNFAHGDIIMIGAYVAFFSINSFNFNVFLTVLLSVIVCTLLGIIIEKLAYKPLRNANSLSVLITAIGVSYFLQNGVQLLWTSAPKMFSSIVPDKSLKLFNGNLSISYITILTIVVCLLIVVGMKYFINNTKTGQAMRACSEDKDAAKLMGINVNKTISITFALGSALAAIASVLFCSTYPIITPSIGSMPGIKAFTSAVFGGIGSIEGALVGGLLLGIIENLTKAYISTQLSDVIVFAFLILVLLIRPYGLFGKNPRVKV